MSSGSAPKRSYEPAALQHEIARLKAEIKDARVQIERLEPFARLEAACIAYGRAPLGAIAGAGERKSTLDKHLAGIALRLEHAETMNGLVQAEIAKSNADAHTKRMNDVLARLGEDAECHEWIRYQRGARPVYGDPARGMPNIAGPKLPEKAPSRERIAKYRALEAERDQIMREGGDATTYQIMVQGHPEYLEIIDAQSRVNKTEAA